MRGDERAAIGASLSMADNQVDEAAGSLAATCDLSTFEWVTATMAEVKSCDLDHAAKLSAADVVR